MPRQLSLCQNSSAAIPQQPKSRVWLWICSRNGVSGRGGSLSAHRAPGRGEVTALLRALRSSLNPPAHHRPNPPLILTLPASNQPGTSQKSLHNTPFFICQHSGTQSGRKKPKSTIPSEGTLPTVLTAVKASFLFTHPHKARNAGEVQIPVAWAVFFPQHSMHQQQLPVLCLVSQGAVRKLKWQLPAPGCNWENAPTQLPSGPGTHS